MLPVFLIVLGAFIILSSLIFYSFFVEFGRGMNVTGCGSNCAIRWSDFTKAEAFIFYVPAIFGLLILILGIYMYIHRKRKSVTDNKNN